MVKHDKVEQSAARSDRLSAALRENLKRRKAQARGRAADEPPSPDSPPAENSEIGAPAPDFRRNPGRNSKAGSDRTGR